MVYYYNEYCDILAICIKNKKEEKDETDKSSDL